MKILTRKRLLSLLLALAMALALTPAALLAEGDGSGDEDTSAAVSGDRLSFAFTQGNGQFNPEKGLEIAQLGNAPTIRVTISARDASGASIRTHDDDHIAWTSADPEIAEPHVSRDATSGGQETGRTFYIEAKKPGITTVTGSVTDSDGRPLNVADQYKTITFTVTVSGILPNSTAITIKENESKTLPMCQPDTNDPEKEPLGIVYYGAAAQGAVTFTSNQPNVVDATGNDRGGLYIDGVSAGTTFVTVSSGIYSAQITVTVEPNVTQVIEAHASASEPLKFATLESQIAAQCQDTVEGEGNTLASISNLTVSTAQGVIHLGYNTPDDPGAGAGSSLTYYASGQPRGPYIKDLTFVPNPSFTGEKAVITFTGKAVNNRTFRGRIEVTLEEAKTDVVLTATQNQPLVFAPASFSSVCQQETGSPLSYVIFTLPPASQGTLYQGYKSEGDYAARVSATQQYPRSRLEEITFVPAPGYVGTVRISYAGYSISGLRYNGELVIQVRQGPDDAIVYNDNGYGQINLSQADFEAFCFNATGGELASVTFTPSPASQGTLYYGWNGIRGAAVTAGTAYNAIQINQLTFVAGDGFDSVVRIPFSGTDRSGLSFSGTMELHIQTGGTGDIRYTCAPGESVKFQLSDFASLCQSVTGARLHYITFQSLPDFNLGSVYHNRTTSGAIGTRATTTTRYFNSATPYIANLSFWASSSFRGSVEIPFSGCDVNGKGFTGLLVISSGSGAGSGSSAAVTYSVTGQQPVAFLTEDFEAACREATNTALNYLRFSLPASNQGILYYDYRAGSAPQALDASTSLYKNGEVSVSKVSFMPARGYSGVVSIPFTGYGINGRQFQGIVQVTVRGESSMGSLVRYNTSGVPVALRAYDIVAASGSQPVSLHLTGLPDAAAGKLYYQYESPTKYSWAGNTTTEYSISGDPSVSNLTFIPKAGYTGAVSIPYTATAADGSQYDGAILISVTAPETSVNFDDLSGYSAQTKAAVDYLFSQGVVGGTAPRQFEPGASIRRGDFCLMLVRAFRFNVSGGGQGFTDVPGDAYYAEAVNQLYALGIVGGVGGGRFQPNAPVSRQDAALMVQRTLQKAGLSAPDGNTAGLAAYRDRAQVASYAQGAVSGLLQMGLLPAGNDRISPQADLTRGDMAVLLHRAMTQ